MDTLTHALSGALAARAACSRDVPPRAIPRRVAAGFLACAAPDLDFVVDWLGPAEYVLYHRGVTHSLLLLPFWALLLAWVLAKILREPGGWRALYGTCALALGVHILGDLITTYGTMILSPVSAWRPAWGTTFIIDLWFSGIIVAGLAASAWFWRTRVPALAALAVLCGYVGFQAVLKERALDFGREYARSRGLAGAEVTALPRAVTPFNWTVFVANDSSYRYAHVNLVREHEKHTRAGDGFVARLDAPFVPLTQARWEERPRYGAPPQDAFAREAWNAPPLAFFRWFADLPALDAVTPSPPCAWFIDLRFTNPGRDFVPFRFGACREGGAWKVYERSLDSPVRAR